MRSSLPTSALTFIIDDTGLIRRAAHALFSTRQEVVSSTLAPVQRPQSQPLSDLTNVLARLGPDKYSGFLFDLDHISLDSNVAEYLEGSHVIVKGRLKAFWQGIHLVPPAKFILDNL